MIRIQRASGFADRARAYKVVLDGNVIGEIKNGEQVEFDVAPGKHQLHLKIDWCSSNVVEFEMTEGTVDFECGSNLQGIKIALAIVYAIFLRNKYLWLEKR